MKKMFRTFMCLSLAFIFALSPVMGVSAKTKAPKTPTMTLDYSSGKGFIKLSWNKISCDGYRLYRKEKGGDYSLYKEFDENTTSYTDKSKNGKTYSFKLRAYNLNKNDKMIFGDYCKSVSGYRYSLTDYFALDQRKAAPNGCELYALAILLHHNGVDVDPLELCKKIPKESSPYGSKNGYVGGNPNRAFLGEPTSYAGWGVYNGPIEKLAKKYLSKPKNITGSSLDEVLKVVSEGNAVQVWTTIGNGNYRVYGRTWTDTKTGQRLTWKVDNHSLVIIGYTKTKIICSDPLKGKIVAYDRTVFEKNFDFHGKQAIYYPKKKAVAKEENKEITTSASSNSEIVIYE